MHRRGHGWDLREGGQEGISSNYTLINFFYIQVIARIFQSKIKISPAGKEFGWYEK